MDFDIDNLTEEELLELNHRVVERLKYLDQVRDHAAMLKLRPGDRVSFIAKDGREVCGVLMKYNKKTVSVVTDSGQKWNVSPGFLRAEAIDGSSSPGSTAISINRRS